MQAAIDYLTEYKKQIEPLIDNVYHDAIEEAATVSQVAEQAVRRYRHFMIGGKKHRGALTKLGYEIITNEYNDDILKASLAVEITHAFLLIHDDYMDQDDTRRGEPTIHKQYESDVQTYMSGDSLEHFGASMAINVGDVGMYTAIRLFSGLGFSPDRINQAIHYFSKKITEVAFGQMHDVAFGIDKPISLDEVMLIHRYKTGDYSGSLPLMIGAMLAGAQKTTLDAMFEYGLRIGTAFQYRDDELGLFFDKGSIGKPPGSDVRQNKNTVLKVKAIELAKDQDKAFLQQAYGNVNLTASELDEVKQITKKSGAYDYSRNICQTLTEEAQTYIPQITDDVQQQNLLHSIATFMIERER